SSCGVASLRAAKSFEPAGHHVQVHAAAMQECERRDHLGGRVRMHVRGLNRDERAQPARYAEYQLRDEPSIELAVVREHENSLASGLLAPHRDFFESAFGGLRFLGRGYGAGREDLDARVARHGAPRGWLMTRDRCCG